MLSPSDGVKRIWPISLRLMGPLGVKDPVLDMPGCASATRLNKPCELPEITRLFVLCLDFVMKSSWGVIDIGFFRSPRPDSRGLSQSTES